MDNKIIDVLPPYDEEVLICWIVRMLRMNSCKKLSPNSQISMRELFGPDSTSIPGLYYQKGLSYFAGNCKLSMCEYFSCEENIVNKMTVFQNRHNSLELMKKILKEKR